jgi:hypothetical protein
VRRNIPSPFTGPTQTKKLNLTELEVEATRGIGRRQLRVMRMRGNGPRWIKISGQLGQRGGRVLYPVDQLDSWIAQCPGGGGTVSGGQAAC